MPLKGRVRYRYKKGTKTRLAFRGNKVIEVKNMRTGKVTKPTRKKRAKKRK